MDEIFIASNNKIDFLTSKILSLDSKLDKLLKEEKPEIKDVSTRQEVADFLNISISTVDELRREKELVGYIVNKRSRRYSKKEVLEYKERQEKIQKGKK